MSHLIPRSRLMIGTPLPSSVRRMALAAILSAQLAGGVATASPSQQSVTIRGDVSVFDGDTLEIGPMLIRLHGVDAPEKTQRCETPDGNTWRCGATAVNRVHNLIEGEDISCEALDRDPYGRIISRCSVGGRDIGATLVAEGLAWAFIEYSNEYVALESEARTMAVGVWQAETQTPWDFRDDKWNRALADAPDGKCPIKGNIGASKGKLKIYHTPWSPNYSNTRINPEDGERWFCDEAEALAAGWRPVAGR
ncbi:thermonuclease family protein [Roseobacter sp. EG26]|uniref:thermonuclease family protein n=1 Tax=Roseobacter sp. EG26 TaxID=3412477 RepID=UPI003CE50BD5